MEDSEKERWEVCSENYELEAKLPMAPEKSEEMEESKNREWKGHQYR